VRLSVLGRDLAEQTQVVMLDQGSQMSSQNTPQFLFHSPPFFSASWIGSHPHDKRPRMVVCFGPTLPDDFAALQAAVLGLGSVLEKDVPPLTAVSGQVDDHCLVLSAHGHELLRTDPLPAPLLGLLQRCPEVLLVWVDVPLQDPRADLWEVGMEHVWTGLAQVHDSVR
jgi:hypothetical protein